MRLSPLCDTTVLKAGSLILQMSQESWCHSDFFFVRFAVSSSIAWIFYFAKAATCQRALKRQLCTGATLKNSGASLISKLRGSPEPVLIQRNRAVSESRDVFVISSSLPNC